MARRDEFAQGRADQGPLADEIDEGL